MAEEDASQSCTNLLTKLLQMNEKDSMFKVFLPLREIVHLQTEYLPGYSQNILFFNVTDKKLALQPYFQTNFSKEYQFDYKRATDKFTMDIWIYHFYNIMDKKIQLKAALQLMSEELSLHRQHMIWVKHLRKSKSVYFDILHWQFVPFHQPYEESDFYSLQEIIQERKMLKLQSKH